MQSTQHEIVIIGGGMVGLSLAAFLAKHQFPVAIIESKPPVLNWRSDDLTARVSAIHRSSQKWLSVTDAWKNLLPESYTPLREMHVWDFSNAQMHFDSATEGFNEMGWIVENRAIVKSLWESLTKNPHVTFYCPAKPSDLSIQNDMAILTFDDQTQISCNLIVGADGANSWLRQHMPITYQKRPYFHKAMVAVIASEKPHQNIAYQQFLKTGPVALLPAANSYHSTLVWSATDPISNELIQLSDTEFSERLTDAIDHRLGKLQCISKRTQFPLIMRHADEYTSPHCALVGDAAHTIHPLAGQGVNLGFMDAACLAQVLIEAKEKGASLGMQRTLRRYTRWRKADNTLMISAMRFFKDIFSLDSTGINTLRHIGVSAINHYGFTKHAIMKIAMGLSDDLPAFLK